MNSELTLLSFDIGEKTFVAPDQNALLQFIRELHAIDSALRPIVQHLIQDLPYW